MSRARKDPQLTARQQLRELRDAGAHVGAVILVAPTEPDRLADLRGDLEERALDLVRRHLEVHAHEARTHDFAVVREGVSQRGVATRPRGAVPVARLQKDGRPEQRIAANRTQYAPESRVRDPGAARRPRRQSLEALRVAVAESQHQIAAETAAGEMRALDAERVEQAGADVFVERERILAIRLLGVAAAGIVEHDDAMATREDGHESVVLLDARGMTGDQQQRGRTVRPASGGAPQPRSAAANASHER